MGIYIWPWVLSLALLQEDWWYNVIQLRDELEQLVVWQVLESKFTLAGVARISLTQNGMSVAWDNTAALQRIPDELSQFFGGNFVSAQISNKLKQ